MTQGLHDATFCVPWGPLTVAAVLMPGPTIWVIVLNDAPFAATMYPPLVPGMTA